MHMKYIIVLLTLGACTHVPNNQTKIMLIDMGQIEIQMDGRCFAKDISPAVIETVTTQHIASPEVRNVANIVTKSATFQTITRQKIINERTAIRFETVCPQYYSTDLVMTLQRALKARGFYPGPISGIMDLHTGEAIQKFQRMDELDTPFMSLKTAQNLGIVTIS